MRLEQRYKSDLLTWKRCANAYEEAIVCGHPDVRAYAFFEEDLLDALLVYLIRDATLAVRLLDVGCGSGRLHLRYGLKTALADTVPETSFDFDHILASGLIEVDGVDFSDEMLEIAREKLAAAGIPASRRGRFRLRKGSAFDLEPVPGEGIPVAVALCNTIGVMQGSEGAQRLFQALRRVVEPEGGIALISAYRHDAVSTYALGNYESTMNVSGQPCWLRPARFTSREVVPIPLEVKRAFDVNPRIRVAARGVDGALLEECVLERDADAVREVIETGHIRTLWNYESRWYSKVQIAEWIAQHWRGLPSWHIDGRRLDGLRAAPAQLTVLDAGGRLDGFFSRLGIRKGA